MIFGAPSIVTSGLVLNLDAANNKSYPGSGTTWTDLSGNGNNGTLTNFGSQTIWNKDNGGSIVFDGTNDYASFSDANLLPTAGLTVCAWFKTTVANKWIIDKSNGGITNGYLLAGTSAGNMVFYINNISVNSNPSTVTSGLWINIVGTWTPSNSLILYQNGVQVATNTTSIPATINNPSANLQIGRRATAVDYWNGNIAQTQIYNRALTASEVLQNYNALKSRFNL